MALDTPADAPSRLDEYELLKEQADGGYGSLWIARTSEEGDPPPLYTVLRINRQLVKKPEAAEAFVAEVQKDLHFRSPNLLATVAAGIADGEIFVVSQYVEGESLAALLTAAGAEGLAMPILLRIHLDVLAAMAAGHSLDKPVVHGEIGPQHIRIGVNGVSRIGGFGVARASTRLSAQGAKSHDRLAYAAPERVKGMASTTAPQVALDPRADVFSLGVLLWEAISHQRLFASRIEAAVIQKVLTAPIASLANLPGISAPPLLDDVVRRALERDPSRRIKTAGELFAALQTAGPGWVASHGEVAAKLDKLLGKSIAERRMELAAALGRKHGEPTGAAPRPASSPAVKAVSAPTGAAPAAAPAPEVSKPAPTPVVASKPVPTSTVPGKAVAKASAAKPPSTPLAPAAARSLPSRQSTILGGAAAKAPPPAPAPAKVEPKPPVADEDWGDSALSDDAIGTSESAPVAAPPPAPKPAVARSPARASTSLGGFGAKVTTPSPAATTAAVSAVPATPTTSARTITKPQVARGVAILEAPAAGADDVATIVTAFAAKDFGPAGLLPTNEPKVMIGGSSKSAPFAAVPVRGRSASAIDQVGPGSTLGRYEILMPIARGGMASVWAARLQGSRGFQKLVAVKTMLPDVSDDPDFETMFLDEATVAARIRHPNVAEISDLGEDNDVLYLVMEWIDGENLSTVIKGAKAIGGIPLPIVLRIASQASAGLHAAHELRDDAGHLVDLIHRDVSPANVLVSTQGFVKLVDFGVAKSKNRMHVTRVGGTVKGKTPYLSPEQLGQLPLDRRSDIFSFGVLLYVLATGLHPFRGETEAKTIENIALREPVPLQTIDPMIPIEFEQVVFKALQKDREKRYATAAELQRALDQVAVSLGLTAGDADVAAFVLQVAGEASQKRVQDIRAAITSLDGLGPQISDFARVEAKPPKPPPDSLEEVLPTASTRNVAPAAGSVEVAVEVDLPQADVAPVSAPGGPISSLEAVLPLAPIPPPPAGAPVPITFAAYVPPVQEDRPPSALEGGSSPSSTLGVRPGRRRTIAIVAGASLGGVGVAVLLAMALGGSKPSSPELGIEGTAASASLSASQVAAPVPPPPSVAAPPPSATASAVEPPVVVDPPIFKGRFPPSPRPPTKPGAVKPPPPPAKPPAKQPKFNPSGI